MLRHHVAVALLLCSTSAAARAQDVACDPEAADGGVNAFGQCAGDLLKYCSGGVVQSYDCSHEATPDDDGDDYYPPDVDAACALISDDYGYDCAITVGGACLFDDQGNVVQAHCAGAQPGCVFDLATERSSCVDDAPACPADGGVGCVGDVSVLGCLHGQVLAIDCASGGGTCATDGSCELPPAGDGGVPTSVCGPCPAGTLCDASTATCRAPNDDQDVRDTIAGAGAGDGTTEPLPEEPAPRRSAVCSAQDIGGDAPLGPIAALVVVASAVRRRRRHGPA